MELISIRKYASRLGVSHTAVNKAIKNQFILKGYDKAAKKILPDLADEEWGFMHKQALDIEVEVSHDTKLGLDDSSTFAEARRVGEVLRAKLLHLEFGKEQGRLVDKEEVNKQLGAFAIELRNALLAIPDRISADVFASNSEVEVNNIITVAIRSAMEDAIERQVIK